MDSQENINTPHKPTYTIRSENMAFASMILGIIALLTSACIYLAVVCGALGMILALLSRGSEKHLSLYGRAGLILNIAGLITTFLIYLTAILFLFFEYGGIDAFLKEYSDLYQSMGIQQF